MRRSILLGTAVLAVILFAIGHAISFLVTVLAMTFDLPGPYSDDPIAWIWFGLSLLIVVVVSFLFCRWFARRIDKSKASKAGVE